MKKNNYLMVLMIATSLLFSCAEKEIIKVTETEILTDTIFVKKVNTENQIVKLGIDVLEEAGFENLRNKKVGLITNQTGVNIKLKSTADIFHETSKVNLVALFAPEHGVRGDVEGGEYVEFYNDKKTGLPVYSLYGKTRKPSKEVLSKLDILVYDIQDIGVRSYTFISTLGLAIEAASEAGIDFLILDRPNPLGGEKVEGNIVEEENISFISQFPIPYVYGLTCGELANLLIGEKLIDVDSNFSLKVIPMQNWKREMTWAETGLTWIPTSPHIPQYETAFFYPMTGILGELRSAISIGVGYTLPFQIIGATWIDPNKFSDYLNEQNIPGLFFRPITYKPYYAFGKGKTLFGVQIHITDYEKVNLTKTQFQIIDALQKLYPEQDLFELADKNQIRMFNNGIGTNQISELMKQRNNINKVIKILDRDLIQFKNYSSNYILYK